jgi:hypothetical protein
MPRFLLTLALISAIPLGAANPDAYDDLAREIYKELVEIRSSEHFPENTIRLLDGVAARLRAEGFAADEMTFVPSGKVKNLVVRYKGTGEQKPLLTMAHIDVVDAEADAWKADPFTLSRHRWLLLRTWDQRQQSRRRHPDHQLHPAAPRGLSAQAGPDYGPDRR